MDGTAEFRRERQEKGKSNRKSKGKGRSFALLWMTKKIGG
jgi:hypothetical protein